MSEENKTVEESTQPIEVLDRPTQWERALDIENAFPEMPTPPPNAVPVNPLLQAARNPVPTNGPYEEPVSPQDDAQLF